MIKNCSERKNIDHNKRLVKAYSRIQLLIEELNKKEIPDEIAILINSNIKLVDSFEGSEKELTRLINKTCSRILDQVKKELGLVTKHYYQNIWMAIGMTVFGMPFGILWFAILQNPAFIAIGLPMGLPIGMAIGIQKDKKAKEENKQLQID